MTDNVAALAEKLTEAQRRAAGPSVGEPGYLPYCGGCSTMRRMQRTAECFKCTSCGLETRRINGEDMFERTAPLRQHLESQSNG